MVEMELFELGFNNLFEHPEGTKEDLWIQDSTLVRYRSLLYFLTKKERTNNAKDDDVLAVDYNDQWSTDLAYAKEELVLLNKMLSHLSFSRVEILKANRDVWNIGKVSHLKKAFRIFLQRLPPERRAWFDRKLLKSAAD